MFVLLNIEFHLQTGNWRTLSPLLQTDELLFSKGGSSNDNIAINSEDKVTKESA